MGRQDYCEFHQRRGHRTEDCREMSVLATMNAMGAAMAANRANNRGSNNRGRTGRVNKPGREAEKRTGGAAASSAAATTSTTTKAYQAPIIPAATMAGQTVGGSADNNGSMTVGDAPGGLGGGVAGTGEEVPPPEGLTVPSRAELMAQIAALRAQINAMEEAKKGTEDPQGGKGK